MILEITCNRESVKVEIGAGSGKSTIRLDERDVACDWVQLPDGQYSLIMDGRVFDLDVDVDGNRCYIHGREERFELGVSDPRRLRAGSGMETGLSGMQRICAEMPGKVIRVMVKAGDAVTLDQGLLVVEAMKMQNEIRAPKSGTIKEVAAISGSAVSTGDFLLSLE